MSLRYGYKAVVVYQLEQHGGRFSLANTVIYSYKFWKEVERKLSKHRQVNHSDRRVQQKLTISVGYLSSSMLHKSCSVTAFGKVFAISRKMIVTTLFDLQASLTLWVRKRRESEVVQLGGLRSGKQEEGSVGLLGTWQHLWLPQRPFFPWCCTGQSVGMPSGGCSQVYLVFWEPLWSICAKLWGNSSAVAWLADRFEGRVWVCWRLLLGLCCIFCCFLELCGA